MRLAAFIMITVLAAGSAAADGREGRKYGGKKRSDAAAAAVDTTTPAPVSDDHEPNVYRFGATYASQPGAGPFACENACSADSQCRAWSHINAFAESPARCELKRAVGKTEENLAATSGLIKRGTNYLPVPVVSSGTLSGAPVVTTTRTYVSSSTASAVPVSEPVITSAATPAGTMIVTPPTIVSSVATPLGSTPSITYTSPATGPVIASTPTPLGASPSVTYAPVPAATSPATRYPVTAPQTYYPNSGGTEPTGTSSYYPERPRVLLPSEKPATETPAQ